MTRKDISTIVLFLAFLIAFASAFSIKPSLGILVFSSGFLVALIYGSYKVFQIKRNGIEAKATITEIQTDNKGYQKPVLEFETHDGQKITGQPYVSSSLTMARSWSEKAGQAELKVLYNKKKPEQFIIPGYRAQNALTFSILAVFAAGLFIVGLLDFLSIIHV